MSFTTSPTLFLFLLFVIGLIGKNQSIIIATLFLMLVKWSTLAQYIFPFLDAKGLNLGVTIITIAILVPIATGSITLHDLYQSIKSVYGVVALIAGFCVALLGASGIKLLNQDPEITMALVLGTIIAVAFFNGVAVGPLIGAGIAYIMMKTIHLLQ